MPDRGTRPGIVERVWWSRGESNSGPRPILGEHLQAQPPVGFSAKATPVGPRVFAQQDRIPLPHTCVSGSGSPLSDVGSGSGDAYRAASLHYLGSESEIIVGA